MPMFDYASAAVGIVAGTFTAYLITLSNTRDIVSIERAVGKLEDRTEELTDSLATGGLSPDAVARVLLRDHLDKFRGPVGSTGPIGLVGPVGKQGDTGEKGARGDGASVSLEQVRAAVVEILDQTHAFSFILSKDPAPLVSSEDGCVVVVAGGKLRVRGGATICSQDGAAMFTISRHPLSSNCSQASLSSTSGLDKFGAFPGDMVGYESKIPNFVMILEGVEKTDEGCIYNIAIGN